MVTFIFSYYILINIVTFILYGIDKNRAKKGRWRISEKVLILFTAIGGALGAILGMKIFRHKTQKMKFKVVPAIFLIVHIIIFGFFAVTTVQIITYGTVYQDEEADVAIVLGAATTGKEVKPVFKERLNEAIKLYMDGKCKRIILTGGYPVGSDVADSVLAEEYAMEQGVPASDLLIEKKSAVTEENLFYAKEIMDEYGYTSALIISDPYHMIRAVTMAKNIGIKEIYPAPTQTSMYKSLNTKIKFLNREELYYVGYLILRTFNK